MNSRQEITWNFIFMYDIHQNASHEHSLQGSILVSDFLFEADTVEDAQKNFEDILELQTNIGRVLWLK